MMMPNTKIYGLIVCAALLMLSRPAASGQTPDYNQPYRPQVHFSPLRHWTNDPNGLVYFRGEYHLFFQYNPFGDEWGHMSWGHAVSTDMLHWHQLPVAIPEAGEEMVFTGSVVVDRKNSSGFCSTGRACLVAVYTANRNTPSHPLQTQNLAYSLDNGRTWTRYKGNPVLDLHLGDFRDPSVSWNEAAHHWIMAVSLPTEHKIQFYSSLNLKKWRLLSEFGPAGNTAGVWECPDLLRIPPATKDGKDMWALKIGINPGSPQGGSGEQYFLGSFNGRSFTPSTMPGAYGWTNHGKDDYCAISFNGLPKGQRPVLIGWMNNWQYAAKLPTSPWRGQMSLPRRLSILKDDAGLALRQEPVIAPLRTTSVPVRWTAQEAAIPYELDVHFEQPGERAFGIRLYSDKEHWTEIGFDTVRKRFYIDRTRSGATVGPGFPVRTVAPLAPGRPYDLRLVVDRSSVEAYAQNGTIAMTNLIYPPSPHSTIQFFSQSGKPVKVTGRVWELRSIWQQFSRN